MFTVDLFTVAETQKQFKCPDDWTKKMWYVYTAECYSAIKKNESCHSQQIIMQSEVSQAPRDKNLVTL